jgi:hypothetical protein
MQLLAVKDEHSSSVMVTLYRFSPYSAVSIIPFALGFEAPALIHSSFAHSGTLLTQALLYAVFGGVVSFLLIVVEVKLLRITSSLTMCVIGQIKEIIQIGAAMLLFKDHITTRSGVGIFLSILAAYWYRHLKNAHAEEDDLDEQRATMQILQSAQLAHRGVRGMGLHGHGYANVRTGDSPDRHGRSGSGHMPLATEDEDEDALLFEQEMVQLDSPGRVPRLTAQELELTQITQMNPLGNMVSILDKTGQVVGKRSRSPQGV